MEEDRGFHGSQIHVGTSLYSTRNIYIPLGKILYRFRVVVEAVVSNCLPSVWGGDVRIYLYMYVLLMHTHTYTHVYMCIFFLTE